MISHNIDKLPFTRDEDIKREWSYLYAYNLRTLRDIFIYCNSLGSISGKKLYSDMESGIIAPPKDHWINKLTKREGRLRLEYIHAAEYLNLINKINGDFFPNIDSNKNEKQILIKENIDRVFVRGSFSPPFSHKEALALTRIVLTYERARDFLHWFLDLSNFPIESKISIDEFLINAKPILLLAKSYGREKGSHLLKRKIDGKLWTIPDDYIRLASGVFPAWFMELGIIDKVVVFPEYGEDNNIWHMYYPVKMGHRQFDKYDFLNILKSTFLSKNQKETTIWIPYLIYTLAKECNVSVDTIKKSLINAHKNNPSCFYMDRVPSHLMKSRLRYKQSYIEINGFYRSHLRLIGA